jgi:hypothetical protein
VIQNFLQCKDVQGFVQDGAVKEKMLSAVDKGVTITVTIRYDG